jgi:hypothetical protein
MLITNKDWGSIEARIRADMKDRGAATRDLNALQNIVCSDGTDVWITFNGRKLWWCQLSGMPVEADGRKKFRRTANGWHDTDVQGHVLYTADIPGCISQVQGFRAAVCSVKALERLRNLINGETSTFFNNLRSARDAMVQSAVAGISDLHPKDFEILVDLVFRQSGWRRSGVLGENMDLTDLELEEPITGDRYMVQVKSSADLAEFNECKRRFPAQGYRKMFFVVHTPSKSLRDARAPEEIELILPERLAQMVVDAGLVAWLMKKVR